MFQKPSPDIALEKETQEHTATKDDVETVVGPSVHVEGDFASEGNILVKGTVSGNVKTSKRLTVEEGAKIFANVKAGVAQISGEIQGNVKIEDTLELTSTARIAGDTACNTLIVESGALIYGKVIMKGIKSVLASKPDKERKRTLIKNKKSNKSED